MSGLFLDVTLIGLLACCLVFCWRLDRRLAKLRSGQDGLKETVMELAEASRHAENAVRSLKAAAAESGRELQARIDEARGLSDRLGGGRGARRERGW